MCEGKTNPHPVQVADCNILSFVACLEQEMQSFSVRRVTSTYGEQQVHDKPEHTNP